MGSPHHRRSLVARRLRNAERNRGSSRWRRVSRSAPRRRSRAHRRRRQAVSRLCAESSSRLESTQRTSRILVARPVPVKSKSLRKELVKPSNRRRIRQHELTFRSWGGARRGSGKKPSGSRTRVPHFERPAHDVRSPLHVTLRLHDGLPSLRRRSIRTRILGAMSAGRDRFGLRLTHFSLQSNHLHMIVEADDRGALSRGMKGLAVRLARALNRLWNRRGSVFSDRFHARALRTPREVRAAIVYVLQNARHHGLRILGVDPFSSGSWFDGWRQGRVLVASSPCVPARTWLLSVGWKRHGLIGIEESPRRSP